MLVDDCSVGTPVKETFEAAFRANFDDLYRYAVRRAGPTLAEDAVAETFARAVSQYSSFDTRRGSIRAWLFGIENNVLRESTRRETKQHQLPARAASDERSPEAERIETSIDVKSVLALLPARSAELLLLVDGFALSYREAARVVGIPIGTVRSRLSMARHRFRLAMSPSADTPKGERN